MRLLRSALLLAVSCFALAAPGCGSDDSEVDEVPGPPVELTVPHQKGAADLSEDAEGTATPTPTPAADAEADPDADRRLGHAPAAPDTDTGTQHGRRGHPGARHARTRRRPTAARPRARAPEKFEQFCQENAGAC